MVYPICFHNTYLSNCQIIIIHSKRVDQNAAQLKNVFVFTTIKRIFVPLRLSDLKNEQPQGHLTHSASICGCCATFFSKITKASARLSETETRAPRNVVKARVTSAKRAPAFLLYVVQHQPCCHVNIPPKLFISLSFANRIS